MPIKEQKEELRRVRQVFRKDLAKLKAKFENLEIAGKTGIDPGNLSSYASGKGKQPGLTVLGKFYKAYEGELDNPLEKINSMEDKKENREETKNEYQHADVPPADKTGEPQVVPMYQPDETAYLRSTINKLLDSSDKLLGLPYVWADSLNKMVATQDKSNQATLIMVETHQKIIDSFLRKNGG